MHTCDFTFRSPMLRCQEVFLIETISPTSRELFPQAIWWLWAWLRLSVFMAGREQQSLQKIFLNILV